jgi:tripeptidyl-peptidase I
MPTFLKLASLLGLALAAPLGPRVTLEGDVSTDVSVTAPQWRRERRAGAGDVVSVTVLLHRAPSQLAALETAFWAVSEPSSPRYGAHLTQEQVTGIVAAPAATIAVVSGWLRDGGATTVRPNVHRDLISATLAADKAEALFGVALYTWRHATYAGIAPIVRASSSYSVPASLGGLLSGVDGLLRFPILDSPRPRPDEEEEEEEERGAAADNDNDNDAWPTDCGAPHGVIGGKYTTPGVLTLAYSLGAPPAAPAKGRIGVYESQGEFWDDKDLAGFGAACGINATIDFVVGDNNPKKCSISPLISPPQCKESLLDIQTIKGISGAVPLMDVYAGQTYDLMAWAAQIGDLADGTLPLVQSVSYGRDESQETGDAYIQALSAEFMKLGSRGVSVIVASGDMGVSGRSGTRKKFHAGFPASSPYVTAVGGTNFGAKVLTSAFSFFYLLATNSYNRLHSHFSTCCGGRPSRRRHELRCQQNTVGEEWAWSGSGGGFSDHFGVPAYQAAAVAAYLARANANATFPDVSCYNATGRGFPDVSALGGSNNPYFIWNGGKKSSAYGTSAGTPVVAVVVAKLNELRLAAGKPPMGFINPFFYANAGPGGGFNDVTAGVNCGLPGGCPDGGGFPATPGWDAATGLGTPNFSKLAALAM